MKKFLIVSLILFSFNAFAQSELASALKKAEAGDVEAQHGVGLYYFHAGNAAEAEKWFARAYSKGNYDSAVMLGNIYLNSSDPKVQEKAYKPLKDASDKANSVAAQVNLGYMYHEGKGVAKDLSQSRLWLMKAAKQVYPEDTDLSHLPVEEREKTAERIRAISQAQFMLGLMYEHGEGVVQDTQQASMYFRLSARHGYTEAQVSLGNLFYEGQIGFTNDLVTGCAWLYIPNDPKVQEKCDKELDESEKRRAISLRDELKKRYPLIN
ncbi:MAG: sel1 repeat family protein [Deferribacteraceae bacterium]|jgi:TPR repeat protein|nr:sel1 repeat family protein [Deferribacteraceae bacterium]